MTRGCTHIPMSSMHCCVDTNIQIVKSYPSRLANVLNFAFGLNFTAMPVPNKKNQAFLSPGMSKISLDLTDTNVLDCVVL